MIESDQHLKFLSVAVFLIRESRDILVELERFKSWRCCAERGLIKSCCVRSVRVGWLWLGSL